MQDPPPSNPIHNPNPNSDSISHHNVALPSPPAVASQPPPPPPPKSHKPPPPVTNATASTSMFSNIPNSSFVPRVGSHHRRSHSEVSYRLPDDMMDLSASDPFNGGSSTASLDEIGSEDDLFSTYIDVKKLGGNGGGNFTDHNENGGGECGGGGGGGGSEGEKATKPRHRHSVSVDGTTSNSLFGEIMEAKKAMPPDKLAELWASDPKRAKRILANRQSAARSKERKARYIQELERKVQTLQTEATTLSAQLTLFQRDTTGLSTENTELKLRLQAMEQQAQLRDALNEALKNEVERLKIATGEIMSPSESFNLGMHQHVTYTPSSSYIQVPQQPESAGTQNMQLAAAYSNHHHHHPLQLHPLDSHSLSLSLSEVLQSDPLGRLQGLDISSKGSSVVKSEAPSISASESSTTF